MINMHGMEGCASHHIGMLHVRRDQRLVQSVDLVDLPALVVEHLHRNCPALPNPCAPKRQRVHQVAVKAKDHTLITPTGLARVLAQRTWTCSLSQHKRSMLSDKLIHVQAGRPGRGAISLE